MTSIERILDLADEKKVPKSRICELIGSNRNKVNDWVNGKSSPTYEEILKLADFFEVSFDYLNGKSDIKEEIQKDGVLTSDEKKLLENYNKLDKTHKKKIRELINDEIRLQNLERFFVQTTNSDIDEVAFAANTGDNKKLNLKRETIEKLGK